MNDMHAPPQDQRKRRFALTINILHESTSNVTSTYGTANTPHTITTLTKPWKKTLFSVLYQKIMIKNTQQCNVYHITTLISSYERTTSKFVFLVDALNCDQLDFEDERGVGADLASAARRTVGHVWGNVHLQAACKHRYQWKTRIFLTVDVKGNTCTNRRRRSVQISK